MYNVNNGNGLVAFFAGHKHETLFVDSCLRRNEGKGVGLRGYKAEIRRCVAWNEDL